MRQIPPESRLVAGTRQVLKAIGRGTASRIWLAQDASPRLREEILLAARAASVPVVPADSMAALGRLCRIGVPAAAAAELPSAL